LKLAGVRLGDAGAQAVIEFVGENDRVKEKATAVKPSFAAEDEADQAVETVEPEASTEKAAEETASQATEEKSDAE
jgi:large subunit ribosomal protein L17